MLEKQELDVRIEMTAKSLLSYCKVRTSNVMDAEDLAQEIIVEVYRSADRIRKEDAFYGFLWAVAGNVYKQWCRKKAARRECVLSDTIPSEDLVFNEEDILLARLRRELTLLQQNNRKAIILYYLENLSCAQIAEQLSVSESMVKYLLFKSRQILKEGMGMERTYGQQSYAPKGLKLLFWGNHGETYYHLADNKISQNILFACYHDRLTAEQISLEIGVALPYMEEYLAELSTYGLLRKEGRRYSTNIAIFTHAFYQEAAAKTAQMRETIAALLLDMVQIHEKAICDAGFDETLSYNCRLWQVVCFVLYDAIIEKLQGRLPKVDPETQLGTNCVIWGVETGWPSHWNDGFCFGISNATNAAGDYMQFMDFPVHGEMVHEYFYKRQDAVNLFLDVAANKRQEFHENDQLILAELLHRGYITAKETGYAANVPVLSQQQYQCMKALVAETSCKIADAAEQMLETITLVLKDHLPTHLKKFSGMFAYFRLFEDAISAPVQLLCAKNALLPCHGERMLPTTYVVLK